MPRIKSRFLAEDIPPGKVIDTLAKRILVDGFHIVVDLERSKGTYMVDARDGRKYLDMYSYFSTLPIGHNHPKMTDRDFLRELRAASLEKPANSDVYTEEYADFVEAFNDFARPKFMKHFFFISGGALAVENTLKTAMDWKIRKNFARGSKGELGKKVIHFREAFHGRSGYTLSLTNTADTKIKYFPKFKWPRVLNPKLRFPVTEKVMAEVEKNERKSLAQISAALDRYPKDISCLIIEPIQGEGGDNHFRKEFLQALENVCRENDIMYILDEIQTGFGATGKMWAFEHFGIKPDIMAFGKKSQICGIMASGKVDEVKENVFHVSSRINSTWGGNLVDMVRCKRYLEIIMQDNLLKNAERMGRYFLQRLGELAEKRKEVSNVRGRGCFVAMEMPSMRERDDFRRRCWKNGLAVLASWPRSIRFRPPLTVNEKEIDEAIEKLERSFRK
ncbi:MAG: L-lysine 6-transaminase [Candidatus Aenigmarchaeota archaeon]|nr:L-lysine 6-transaminase [Candidatus Aenigmarchaeota archaeon]NIP40390.1 L-lysine 6-transaminase [Candidatus Aenigmarchaeota archaeon]NIQ18316.1 L-lysine 6-transaminase [Candidatus Aenigmarchaeota archaeon]NIS73268.1 L-lysine 6-transaminase [Candidatus Aenigmarchaeota archaeon]